MATITLTEKAASAVQRIMAETLQAEAAKRGAAAPPAGTCPPASEAATATATVPAETKVEEKKLYLRVRVVGGGCSGFQNRLDLDFDVNPKIDEIFECHGVPVVVDKRSLMYLDGVKIDFHDELNRTGFSVVNPNAKSTCGCGSSYSM
jgi:iron-sulfur cluster assembly protein